MKGLKFCALVLSAGMLLNSCGGNMNNTGKGSLIGAGGGAALGTLIGTLASSNKGKRSRYRCCCRRSRGRWCRCIDRKENG